MNGFRYRRAPTSVKIVASGFLVLALAGLGVVLLQIYVKTGLTPRGALAHYRGDEATFQTAMGFGELVEITHAHAFTMPLVALTLGLAFVLTEVSERVKRTVVTALLTGVALMILDILGVGRPLRSRLERSLVQRRGLSPRRRDFRCRGCAAIRNVDPRKESQGTATLRGTATPLLRDDVAEPRTG
jgi:hypothetical protein